MSQTHPTPAQPEPRNGGRLPVTVLVPTIGRPDLLRACLRSVSGCRPGADEVVIVDQSRDQAGAALIGEFLHLPVKVVGCEGRGYALGLNVGLRAARHQLVLVTNDDCTVRPDWVAVAYARARERPGGIVTGRVMPPEDGAPVPSIKVDLEPHDYHGEIVLNALYGGNMMLPRQEVLFFGGFDERPGMRVSSEDNDLCYRWLRAGRSLRYEPDMVVWHNDWRSPEELVQRYVEYARGNGVLYAKYLLRGDRSMLRYAAREYAWGWRSLAAALVRRRPRWQDPRRGVLRGLPVGLAIGLRDELRDRRARTQQAPPV